MNFQAMKRTPRLMSLRRGLQQLGMAALATVVFAGSVQAATDELVYFHTDALGSPTAAFNEAGEVCWVETYSPYGEKLDREDSLTPADGCGLLGTDVGYTGHVQDGSGLVYAQQRYYDPVIGRFMSTDPTMPHAGDPRYFGRYQYGGNNPYKYVDPDGESLKTVKALFNVAKNTYKNGGDIRKASKDELMDIVENVAELADGDFTEDDVVAAVDLLTGFGKEFDKLNKSYFNRKQKKERFDSVDGKCEYCGKDTQMEKPYQHDSAEGDHHIPQSKGGLTTTANQRNACRDCNQEKLDEIPEPGNKWNK